MRKFFFDLKFNFFDVIGILTTLAVFDMVFDSYGPFIAIVAAGITTIIGSFISVTGMKWDSLKQTWKDVYGD